MRFHRNNSQFRCTALQATTIQNRTNPYRRPALFLHSKIQQNMEKNPPENSYNLGVALDKGSTVNTGSVDIK